MKQKNFWQKLKRPFYALAPMAGYTDSAFRQICKDYGADVVYSEMASAAALVFSPEKTLELLAFEAKERPYVVQLFGSRPEHFSVAAKLVESEIGPDGFDLNFGCPVPKVAKQGAGAELMKNPVLARSITEALLGATKLPVSIKIRAGAGKIGALSFLEYFKDLPLAALMIHGRTLKQGFSGGIDFELIKKVRGCFGGIIVANGGIANPKTAGETLRKTGADGLGIARGALGRPWIFSELKNGKEEKKREKGILKIALAHAKLANKMKGERGMVESRKHLCWYVQGLAGAKKIRERLVRIESLSEAEKILKHF